MRIASPSFVKSLLRYEPATGFLYWKNSRGGKLAGSRAGTVNNFGYTFIRINKKSYMAADIVFLLCNGKWPSSILDHDDGNQANNRIWNLKEATQSKNIKNCKRHRDNTSGVTGVSWNKNAEKWMAYIFSEGKYFYLGLYKNISEASKVRKSWEIKLDFHPNHGRAA